MNIKPIEIVTLSSINKLANSAAMECEGLTADQRCFIYRTVVERAEQLGLLSSEDAYQLASSSSRWFFENKAEETPCESRS